MHALPVGGVGVSIWYLDLVLKKRTKVGRRQAKGKKRRSIRRIKKRDRKVKL